MSKLTDFYAHKAILKESGHPTDPQWEQLEDQLLKEELLPELIEQLRTALSKVKSPLMFNGCYDPNGCLSVSFTRSCAQTCVTSPMHIVKQAEIEFEPVEDEPEETATSNESVDAASLMLEPEIQKAKSIGFSVSFRDGTVFHEPKAVNTWILTLKKIGLENIYNNRSRLKAWHKVVQKDVCVVEKTQTFRKDGKSPQKLVDGFFVMVQLSNESKVEDIEVLSTAFPALGIKVTWDNGELVSTQEETPIKPVVQDNTAVEDLPIKERYRAYLARTKSEGTANTYTSTLDNPVRHFINQKVDASADSIFSYTNSEEVSICIEMLNASMDYVAENDRKHHSMSAALRQYQLFIQELEKTN